MRIKGPAVMISRMINLEKKVKDSGNAMVVATWSTIWQLGNIWIS